MRNKLFFMMALISLFALNAFAQTPKVVTSGAVNGGVINGKATSLPKPVFPQAAQAVRANGAVNVAVTIDENGDVISASAVSGHPLLRQAAEQAARQAKFAPTMLSGQPVKVTGIIVYNFILPVQWRYVGLILGDAEAEIEDEIKLKSAAAEFGDKFPDEGKALQAVVANFDKDEESGRYQNAAIGQIISSLESKLSAQAEDLWSFQLGLTIGRVNASSYEDAVLRDNLARFKQLYDSAPEKIDEDTLDALRSLGEMAGKNAYTRRDKKAIKNYISDL